MVMRIGIFAAAAMVAAMALPACEGRRQKEEPILQSPDVGFVVGICFDLSGSYQNLMVEDGKAYKFAISVVDKYFGDRAGSDDRLVIGQISAIEKALLWEGSGASLKA